MKTYYLPQLCTSKMPCFLGYPTVGVTSYEYTTLFFNKMHQNFQRGLSNNFQLGTPPFPILKHILFLCHGPLDKILFGCIGTMYVTSSQRPVIGHSLTDFAVIGHSVTVSLRYLTVDGVARVITRLIGRIQSINRRLCC